MAELTLTEKVYGRLVAEHQTGAHPLEAVATYPRQPQDAFLRQFELDCRDWGFVFGVAYGIARSEDPFEGEGSVTERALVAARDAFARWGGDDIFTTEAFYRDRMTRGPVAEGVA